MNDEKRPPVEEADRALDALSMAMSRIIQAHGLRSVTVDFKTDGREIVVFEDHSCHLQYKTVAEIHNGMEEATEQRILDEIELLDLKRERLLSKLETTRKCKQQ